MLTTLANLFNHFWLGFFGGIMALIFSYFWLKNIKIFGRDRMELWGGFKINSKKPDISRVSLYPHRQDVAKT